MEENKERKFKLRKEHWTWGLTALIVICLSILFFFAVYRWNGLTGGYKSVKRILQPFIVGAILAWLVAPLFNAIERRLKHRWEIKLSENKARNLAKLIATIVSIVALLGILYAFFAMIVPQLISSISSIVANSKDYMDKITAWADGFAEKNPDLAAWVTTQFNNIFGDLDTWVNNTILPRLTGIISGLSTQILGVFKFLINFLIGIVVCIYVLNSKRTLLAQSKRIVYSIFRVDRANTLMDSARFANKVFYGFISGKLWDSLIIGIICFICVTIMKMPYSLLVSVIVGVTNIIPCFGPFIGAIPCALLILIESPIKCLYFIIFIIILQQIDGNIIGPKILGDSVGISALWILFSIVFFGGFWGFAGMVLGVPVFTCIYTFLRWLIKRSLAKKHLPQETDAYYHLYNINAETLEMVPLTAEQKRNGSRGFGKEVRKSRKNGQTDKTDNEKQQQ